MILKGIDFTTGHFYFLGGALTKWKSATWQQQQQAAQQLSSSAAQQQQRQQREYLATATERETSTTTPTSTAPTTASSTSAAASTAAARARPTAPAPSTAKMHHLIGPFQSAMRKILSRFPFGRASSFACTTKTVYSASQDAPFEHTVFKLNQRAKTRNFESSWQR